MPRTNPDSEENIRRIDSARRTSKGGGTHGFQVHFNRSGVNYTRLISDSPTGGKENARELAREFREVLRAAIPPTLNGPSRSGPARSNTGRMGISVSGLQTAALSDALIVQANVRVAKGKPMNKKFNVRDFQGLNDTIQQAVSWREEVLQARAETEREA